MDSKGSTQMGKSDHSPKTLSEDLVNRIMAELGVTDPLVVIVLDKNEVAANGEKVEPYVGYPSGVELRMPMGGETMQPVLAFQGSGLCCMNHLLGFFIGGNCYLNGSAC